MQHFRVLQLLVIALLFLLDPFHPVSAIPLPGDSDTEEQVSASLVLSSNPGPPTSTSSTSRPPASGQPGRVSQQLLAPPTTKDDSDSNSLSLVSGSRYTHTPSDVKVDTDLVAPRCHPGSPDRAKTPPENKVVHNLYKKFEDFSIPHEARLDEDDLWHAKSQFDTLLPGNHPPYVEEIEEDRSTGAAAAVIPSRLTPTLDTRRKVGKGEPHLKGKKKHRAQPAPQELPDLESYKSGRPENYPPSPAGGVDYKRLLVGDPPPSVPSGERAILSPKPERPHCYMDVNRVVGEVEEETVAIKKTYKNSAGRELSYVPTNQLIPKAPLPDQAPQSSAPVPGTIKRRKKMSDMKST